MRKAFIYLTALVVSVASFAQGKVVQVGESFLQPLQERDSSGQGYPDDKYQDCKALADGYRKDYQTEEG